MGGPAFCCCELSLARSCVINHLQDVSVLWGPGSILKPDVQLQGFEWYGMDRLAGCTKLPANLLVTQISSNNNKLSQLLVSTGLLKSFTGPGGTRQVEVLNKLSSADLTSSAV